MHEATTRVFHIFLPCKADEVVVNNSLMLQYPPCIGLKMLRDILEKVSIYDCIKHFNLINDMTCEEIAKIKSF